MRIGMRQRQPSGKHHALLLFLGTTTLALACAGAPLRERDDVLFLIEQARQAGAEAHAPDLLGKAQSAFLEAQDATDKGEYKQAREILQQAAMTAEEARQQAIARRPSSAPGVGQPGASAETSGARVPEGSGTAGLLKDTPLNASPGSPARQPPPSSPSTAPRPVVPLIGTSPTPLPATALGPVSSTSPAEAHESAAGKSTARGRIHLVKRGETLHSIAKKELGSKDRWREIYEANRDILKTPNSVQAGQKIRIPAK